jgi:NAD-dependent dihydropyrimidine dehydrogenase PreA subunit
MARKRKTAEKGSKDDCRGNPGKVAPVIDRNRCEGKEDCAIVCPYDVFEIGTLSPEDRASLSLVGKLKAWANGNRQAFVVKALECHACNLCVDACPEDALVLAAVR